MHNDQDATLDVLENMLVGYIAWRVRAANELCDLTQGERQQLVELAADEFVDAVTDAIAEQISGTK